MRTSSILYPAKGGIEYNMCKRANKNDQDIPLREHCSPLVHPMRDKHLKKTCYFALLLLVITITREAMQWFWDCYTPESERNKPTVSPLRASLDQLRRLPPALIITDENDVLRDQGEAYAHKLMAAGQPDIWVPSTTS